MALRLVGAVTRVASRTGQMTPWAWAALASLCWQPAAMALPSTWQGCSAPFRGLTRWVRVHCLHCVGACHIGTKWPCKGAFSLLYVLCLGALSQGSCLAIARTSGLCLCSILAPDFLQPCRLDRQPSGPRTAAALL